MEKKTKSKLKRKPKEGKKGEVQEITDSDFDSLIKENNAVLVDFFAEWCMPCVMMVPVIDELARAFSGKVSFAKINVDENHKIASNYKIMSIPTLLIFKNGNLAERVTGALSYDMLKEKINACLNAKK